MKVLLVGDQNVRLEIGERDCGFAAIALVQYLELNKDILSEKAIESISSMIESFKQIDKAMRIGKE